MTSYPSPHCMWCVHYHKGMLACDAFPERIPDDIVHSNHGHRTPHEGDHGIMFELTPGETDDWVGLRPGFEPSEG